MSEFETFTPTEERIKLLQDLLSGKKEPTYDNVAKVLDISVESLRKHVSNMNQKISIRKLVRKKEEICLFLHTKFDSDSRVKLL